QIEPWLYEIRRVVSLREGLGVASFALAWTLEHLFRQRAAHRVYLEVTARNKRARRIYERHGFVLEGTYRDGYSNPTNGQFEDLCVYGLLAPEYEASSVT
ncbi:MAG: GNAT family N-acetyltransferase, partial [Candidatus Eremiobacteraeota bacterium]|nr:GNAT family N-acetyltransferase [Candidatus Eremiobacteraeota bacterium]